MTTRSMYKMQGVSLLLYTKSLEVLDSLDMDLL